MQEVELAVNFSPVGKGEGGGAGGVVDGDEVCGVLGFDAALLSEGGERL